MRRFAFGLFAIIASHTAQANPLPTPTQIHVASASVSISGLDLDDARRELAAADQNDPDVLVQRGRLAIYEGDCDTAVTILSRPELTRGEGESSLPRLEEALGLADIALGCARVTAATLVVKDDAANVVIRYQDEADASLTPLLIDTIQKARDQLTKDLGVTWPKPTRVVVVRDLLALAAMTGLPYESAKTTGTVAVAKWGRVTLLSPRASRHGYAWRDTVAHELTHLAVTRATLDRAPLWLQEGVAKREETRWRAPGPFDGHPSPDTIAQNGIEKGIALALDKLGPSIAMLPSADAAMVAFAEVTSFVAYYANELGPTALPALFSQLRDGKSVDLSLRTASGKTLPEWDKKWRAYLAAQPKEAISPLFNVALLPNAVEMRDRIRLAELLLGRGQAGAAKKEIDKLSGPLAKDPSIRYLQGRILEALGQTEDARTAVGDVKSIVAGFGPWWAIRGRLARGIHDEVVEPSFDEAIAADPFDIEPACQSPDLKAPLPPTTKDLCITARNRKEPDIGQD